MQREKTNLRAARGDLRQQRLGEMQPRRGSRHRSAGPRKDRLVALPIRFQAGTIRAGDIGGQGNLTQGVQPLQDIGRSRETQAAVAFRIGFNHNRLHAAGAGARILNLNPGSRPRPPGRPQHGPPVIDGVFLQKQRLELPSRKRVYATEAGGNHARIIEHQRIPRMQIFNQIRKTAVLKASRVAMQHQQARLITLRRRRLGNQLRRQLELKIRSPHLPRALCYYVRVARFHSIFIVKPVKERFARTPCEPRHFLPHEINDNASWAYGLV